MTNDELRAAVKAQLDQLVCTRFEQIVVATMTRMVERTPDALGWVMETVYPDNKQDG